MSELKFKENKLVINPAATGKPSGVPHRQLFTEYLSLRDNKSSTVDLRPLTMRRLPSKTAAIWPTHKLPLAD